MCEIALSNGDRVQLQLSKTGLVIEQIGLGEQASDVLFEANADLISDMCVALLGPTEAAKTTPLDLLVTVVSQIPSAAHVRTSFRAAADAL